MSIIIIIIIIIKQLLLTGSKRTKHMYDIY